MLTIQFYLQNQVSEIKQKVNKIFKQISNNYYNKAYYVIGFLLLFANKINRTIQGYTNPKPFPITEFERAIDYDFNVIKNWMNYLERYSPKFNLEEKTVLELGPGSDLGVGLILLMNGIKKYNAIDINNLIKSVPKRFYNILFNKIDNIKDKKVDVNFLHLQLELTQLGVSDKLNYICCNNFDLSVFDKEEIDLVVSQASFEHFDDVEKTIKQLSKIVKKGTVLVAEIDLKTHTRWIRDKDPLNIYRFSDFIYNLFRFSGSPNRLRPFEYESILNNYGWENIKIFHKNILDEKEVFKVKNSLNSRFHNNINTIGSLSIIICATKK